jgi:hypothetical protein
VVQDELRQHQAIREWLESDMDTVADLQRGGISAGNVADEKEHGLLIKLDEGSKVGHGVFETGDALLVHDGERPHYASPADVLEAKSG